MGIPASRPLLGLAFQTQGALPGPAPGAKLERYLFKSVQSEPLLHHVIA